MTLQSLFETRKHAFAASPYPTYQQRQNRLQRLLQALKQYQSALQQALSQDFGQRSFDETLLLEVAPCLQGIRYQQRHLKKWMKPQRRQVHYTFAPAKNWVMAQPLGVVGIIVPWNYPVFLALSPLMAALAAGNQVMLKMSEFTPATNQVLQQLLTTALADCVTVVEGDANIAAEFASLPFDHLLFTGSTAVGYKVMQAAAQNLTPITLELGGKSPVIMAADANLAKLVPRLVFGKTANAGQTCVAPDYILAPRAQIPALVQHIQQSFAQSYPEFPNSPDYSAIINERQYQRLTALLAEAKQLGADVISCAPLTKQSESSSRILPLTLVLNLPSNATLLQQEIFGPILPIIPYDDIEQAIAYVQQQPRPLALYLFSNNSALQQRVLQQVHAGGVCLNDTLLHVAQEDLPFGGIGPSGMGHYHGPEGFLRFSHQKAVHQKGRFSSSVLIYPPFNRPVFKALLKWLSR